jgi:hypothetical protein
MYSAAKAVISGSIAEIYLYSKPIEYAYEQPKVQRSITKEKTDEEKQEIKRRSLIQTRRSLRNILQSNAWQFHNDSGRPNVPLFVTFTFRENITALSPAHREFKHFIQRFNHRLYGKDAACIKYLAVPEFQKRGAVHYHVIFFNLPFIVNIYDEINRIWGNGFTLVETIKSLSHMVNYVAKYITADGLDERLSGRKRYFTSRGLKKPREERTEKIVAAWLEKLPADRIVYRNVYSSDYGQETEYINFDLGQGTKAIEVLQLNN